MQLINGEEHYRLMGFDSDHAFVEPLNLTFGGEKADVGVKVNVKNVLYCLSAMNERLDAQAIEDFLAIDPIPCLQDWLSTLWR